MCLSLAENVPKVEPGLPNGAEAGAGAAPPAAAPVKPEPALDMAAAPGLKLDQVRSPLQSSSLSVYVLLEPLAINL